MAENVGISDSDRQEMEQFVDFLADVKSDMDRGEMWRKWQPYLELSQEELDFILARVAREEERRRAMSAERA